MPDPSEIQALFNRQRSTSGPTAEQMAKHLRGSRIVAMQMEDLVGDTAGDTFRKHLTALIVADEAAQQAIIDGITQGLLVAADLARETMRLQYLRGRIEARKEDLDLPGRLIEQAQATEAAAKNLDNLAPGGVAVT